MLNNNMDLICFYSPHSSPMYMLLFSSVKVASWMFSVFQLKFEPYSWFWAVSVCLDTPKCLLFLCIIDTITGLCVSIVYPLYIFYGNSFIIQSLFICIKMSLFQPLLKKIVLLVLQSIQVSLSTLEIFFIFFNHSSPSWFLFICYYNVTAITHTFISVYIKLLFFLIGKRLRFGYIISLTLLAVSIHWSY